MEKGQKAQRLVSQLEAPEAKKRQNAFGQLGGMGAEVKLIALPGIKKFLRENPEAGVHSYDAGLAVYRIGGLSELLRLNGSGNLNMRLASLHGLNELAQDRIRKHRQTAKVGPVSHALGQHFSFGIYRRALEGDIELQTALLLLAKALLQEEDKVATTSAGELLNLCQNVSLRVMSLENGKRVSFRDPTLEILHEYILPSIKAALSNPKSKSEVRQHAVDMISRFDSTAFEVKDILNQMADDSDIRVREHVVYALKQVEKTEKANNH
jgi:hypothetical protein